MTPGSQSSARSWICEAGISAPLISTIMLSGDRSAPRYRIAPARPPRLIIGLGTGSCARHELNDATTSARLKERIVAGAELARDGVVAFRGVDAQRILKEEFAIECSLSSTYRLLHRMQLSWLAPRPRHPQADATAQAEFSQL